MIRPGRSGDRPPCPASVVDRVLRSGEADGSSTATRREGAGAFAIVAVLLAGTTGLVYWLGGAPNTAVHCYYFAIAYAAARFGRAGGALTALAAGLLSGPLMPADTATGEPQTTGSWLLRLVLLLAVAIVVHWLTNQEPRPLNTMLRDVVISRSLRRAIAHGQIEAHYQPIVKLSTGAVLGAEALCRWRDGRGGYYSPAVFVPAAEHTGAISPLGRHMLRIVADRAGALACDGPASPLLTVNVSASQLAAPAFLGDLARTLEASRAAPEHFCLEITETALVQDPITARAVLLAVRRLGVLVALDDFGTGQSSLTYLRHFPIDIIKIDKSFVDDVDRDPTANALVLAIVEMTRALGATCIAEGIERPEQLDSLRALGCEYGQGWLLGRPAPWSATEAEALSDEAAVPSD